jgi:threonine/homoserine/homoserine lactone efflux protein
MVHLIGDLLPYALGVALSPVPLIAVLLLLGSPTGRASSAAFVAARVISVAAVATIVALVAELLPERNGTSPIGNLLRITLGGILVIWAVLTMARRRDTRKDGDGPGWMVTLRSASPPRAARIGVVLSVANVKELAFGVGAGLTIATSELEAGAAVGAAVVYSLLACLSSIVAVVAVWFFVDRVSGPLDQARAWLARNSTFLIALVLLVIGAVLVAEGVRDLAPGA